MTETTQALQLKHDGNNDARYVTDISSRRPASRSGVLGLLCAGLIFGLASHAQAEPTGTPTPNAIFFDCTFTTESLDSALTLGVGDADFLESGKIEASYIIIYVRQNKNDGQLLAGPVVPPPVPPPPEFTGPVVCTNSGIDNFTDINPTTEGTPIAGPVDIVGAEEVSHIQFRTTGGSEADTEKRVCHTVASKTECFLIQP